MARGYSASNELDDHPLGVGDVRFDRRAGRLAVTDPERVYCRSVMVMSVLDHGLDGDMVEQGADLQPKLLDDGHHYRKLSGIVDREVELPVAGQVIGRRSAGLLHHLTVDPFQPVELG